MRLVDAQVFLDDSELVQIVACHYLTGEVLSPLQITDPKLSNGRFARSLPTANSKGNFGTEVVLGGTLVTRTDNNGICIDLPDPNRTHAQLLGGNSHQVRFFDPLNRELITIPDNEIYGGYSPRAAEDKIVSNHAAQLFAPPGVLLPQCIMSGTLIDKNNGHPITGIFPYIKPLTIDFGLASRIEKMIIVNFPDLIDKVNLAERMLYHFMRYKIEMQRKELDEGELQKLRQIYPEITHAKGIANFFTHIGNWGALYDNLRTADPEIGLIYIGDWEKAYFGALMRPELLVADTNFAFGKITDDLIKIFDGVTGGEEKVLNIVLYGLLGLMGVGADDFKSEYKNLYKMFQELKMQIKGISAKDVFEKTVGHLFWSLSEGIYGYDPIEDYQQGHKNALGGDVDEVMKIIKGERIPKRTKRGRR